VNFPWFFSPLEVGRYSVVYADPPWSMYGDPEKDQAAGKHYALIPDETMLSLPVRELCGDDGVAFVWATCPRLDFAIQCVRAWGLHYRGIAYVWVKTRKDGAIINGQGIRPTLVKPTTEMVIAATTCKRGRPLPLLTEAQGQVVLAPRGEHSEKPAEVRRRIGELLGPVPRVELFARERVQGWDSWGDGLGGYDARPTSTPSQSGRTPLVLGGGSVAFRAAIGDEGSSGPREDPFWCGETP
jgi:N6-adenosine-specific RNA methylase IME4